MLIERVAHSGMYVISEVVDGYLFTRRYMGYTKREAIAEFWDDVKEEQGKRIVEET
ncbi:MAG: hypothetical protein ACRCZI_11420 [Cetobacterium sp.]